MAPTSHLAKQGGLTKMKLRRKGLAILGAMLIAPMLTIVTPMTALGANEEGCPATATAPVDHWVEIYRQRGITLCRGDSYWGFLVAYVQVVDLSKGARIRVMSEVAQNSGQPDAQYNKRTALDWYNWQWTHVTTPSAGLIFSATNAAFFIDSNNGNATTPLSLPEKKWGLVQSQGWALTHHSDLAWNAPKRKFGFTDLRSGSQLAYVGDFPAVAPNNTTYTANDVTTGLSGYFDSIVAIHPTYEFAPGSNDRRTMLGTRNGSNCWGCGQEIVYILTTDDGMTVPTARGLLANDFHAMWTVQLDGGNSTQFYSVNAQIDSGLCLVPFYGCRNVPSVLLVYVSPYA
jgi:hypothetical protein